MSNGKKRKPRRDRLIDCRALFLLPKEERQSPPAHRIIDALATVMKMACGMPDLVARERREDQSDAWQHYLDPLWGRGG